MESTRHDPQTRKAVEDLLRGTALTQLEIATRSGVPVSSVRRWCRLGGLRKRQGAAQKTLNPADWPASRLAAVARLYKSQQVDPGDLAEAMGAAASAAPRLFQACGLDGRNRRRGAEAAAAEAKADAALALDGPRLRLALREHLARQIARCDAALRGAARGVDSAKALRDLTGLKRLLDEVEADNLRHRGEADAAVEPGALAAERDLPALRADIARRYAAFAGERAPAGLPGEAAAGADPGAGG